jgi:hypothetical protein
MRGNYKQLKNYMYGRDNKPVDESRYSKMRKVNHGVKKIGASRYNTTN